jgi:hypothetical protein
MHQGMKTSLAIASQCRFRPRTSTCQVALQTPAGHHRQFDDDVATNRKAIHIDSNGRRSTLPLLPAWSDTFTRIDYAGNKAFKKLSSSPPRSRAAEPDSDSDREKDLGKSYDADEWSDNSTHSEAEDDKDPMRRASEQRKRYKKYLEIMRTTHS